MSLALLAMEPSRIELYSPYFSQSLADSPPLCSTLHKSEMKVDSRPLFLPLLCQSVPQVVTSLEDLGVKSVTCGWAHSAAIAGAFILESLREEVATLILQRTDVS